MLQASVQFSAAGGRLTDEGGAHALAQARQHAAGVDAAQQQRPARGKHHAVHLPTIAARLAETPVRDTGALQPGKLRWWGANMAGTTRASVSFWTPHEARRHSSRHGIRNTHGTHKQ